MSIISTGLVSHPSISRSYRYLCSAILNSAIRDEDVKFFRSSWGKNVISMYNILADTNSTDNNNSNNNGITPDNCIGVILQRRRERGEKEKTIFDL